MNNPYIRLDDMEVRDENCKIAITELYKEILKLESSIAVDEEQIQHLIEEVGKEKVLFMYGSYMNQQYTYLASMKNTFYYLTGISSARILIDLTEDEKKSIFSYEKEE
jgi:hypothetical protein